MYTLSKRSKDNLLGVHPTLIAVVQLAIQNSEQDFTVIEGLRTVEKQKKYFAKGVSKTMNSKHLKQADGYAHAVDIYPYYKTDKYPNGAVIVDAPSIRFEQISTAMKEAASALGVKITWGGDWKSFVDTPHYQIEF